MNKAKSHTADPAIKHTTRRKPQNLRLTELQSYRINAASEHVGSVLRDVKSKRLTARGVETMQTLEDAANNLHAFHFAATTGR